jgi:hypothetical protein
MCRCRRSYDIDVKLADDVVVVEIVMVDVVLIVVRVAAIAQDAKSCTYFLDRVAIMEEAPCGYKRGPFGASCRC